MLSSSKDIYFFLGTTAEFIKLSPVIRELKKRQVNYKIICSGQTSIKFEELAEYIGKTKVDIVVNRKPQHSSIILFAFWILQTLILGYIKFRKEFKGIDNKDTLFLVHGDTVSALIGSLLAKAFSLKLVHVEAGLRSYNFLEPFPEEICKVIINRLSDINVCPNEWSVNNLKNLKSEKINTYQNTIIEPFWWTIGQKKGLKYAKKFEKYYILIMHRQEHIYFNKEWTRKVLNMVIENADKKLNCIFIIHALTSRYLKSENINLNSMLSKRIIMVPRLPYMEFLTLMKNAEFIATDGCTNEEEAYYLGLPLLSLRNLTERIEGRNENVLISKGKKRTIVNFLKNYKAYRRNEVHADKSPSKIIVDYLLGTKV